MGVKEVKKMVARRTTTAARSTRRKTTAAKSTRRKASRKRR